MAHSVTITVNTSELTLDKEKLSYSDIVQLAFPGSAPSNIYIIKYSRKADANETKALAPSDSVVIKDGMVFRVVPTGES